MSNAPNGHDVGADHIWPSGFDIRTFEYPACNHVHQIVVELLDPMKSRETNGWLHRRLLAPT
jgi:hypothetical protein